MIFLFWRKKIQVKRFDGNDHQNTTDNVLLYTSEKWLTL